MNLLEFDWIMRGGYLYPKALEDTTLLWPAPVVHMIVTELSHVLHKTRRTITLLWWCSSCLKCINVSKGAQMRGGGLQYVVSGAHLRTYLLTYRSIHIHAPFRMNCNKLVILLLFIQLHHQLKMISFPWLTHQSAVFGAVCGVNEVM